MVPEDHDIVSDDVLHGQFKLFCEKLTSQPVKALVKHLNHKEKAKPLIMLFLSSSPDPLYTGVELILHTICVSESEFVLCSPS